MIHNKKLSGSNKNTPRVEGGKSGSGQKGKESEKLVETRGGKGMGGGG